MIQSIDLEAADRPLVSPSTMKIRENLTYELLIVVQNDNGRNVTPSRNVSNEVIWFLSISKKSLQNVKLFPKSLFANRRSISKNWLWASH